MIRTIEQKKRGFSFDDVDPDTDADIPSYVLFPLNPSSSSKSTTLKIFSAGKIGSFSSLEIRESAQAFPSLELKSRCVADLASPLRGFYSFRAMIKSWLAREWMEKVHTPKWDSDGIWDESMLGEGSTLSLPLPSPFFSSILTSSLVLLLFTSQFHPT